jgi:hypothetical protein
MNRDNSVAEFPPDAFLDFGYHAVYVGYAFLARKETMNVDV